MAEKIQLAGDVASAAVGAQSVMNIVLQFIMNGSANQMLATIKHLQIICHLGLLFVIVPGNASIFLKTIIEMVTFDPVPDLEPHIATVFSLTHDDEIEPDLGARFEAMGYETVFMLEVMGSLTLIIMLQLAIVPFFILGSICCVCSS